MLRNIRMAFKYLDEEMINKLITSLIPPKLEYVAVIWSLRKKKDIKKLERFFFLHLKGAKSSYKNGSKSEKFTL